MASPIAERVVYQSGFETLARAVELDKKPELIAELRGLGYDREKELTQYAPQVLRAVLEALARRTFPELPPEDAYREMGKRSLKAYRSTLVGQVAMAALSMLGVERATKLLARSFRTVTNFSEHEVLPIGERELHYQARHSILPVHYLQGVLQESLATGRHKDVQVELRDQTAETFLFRVTW